MNFSWIGRAWEWCKSTATIKTASRLLGIAATVSTNPAVAAELAIAAKVVDAISADDTEEQPKN